MARTQASAFSAVETIGTMMPAAPQSSERAIMLWMRCANAHDGCGMANGLDLRQHIGFGTAAVFEINEQPVKAAGICKFGDDGKSLFAAKVPSCRLGLRRVEVFMNQEISLV
jgi:hypothetical protein